MRILLRIGLFCLLTVGFSEGLMAQRGGGGHGGGGGGVHGGGGFGGGGFHGGGGFGGGYGRGGYGGYGYGRGYGYGYGRGGYGYGYGYGYPGWGLGLGYWGSPWFGYWDDPYAYDYSYPSVYPAYTAGYGPTEYNPSPNVTVIYPGNSQPTYSAPTQPVMRTYDQYGQEVQPGTASAGAASGSPIYLIATKDQAIRAAASYWVAGATLHYVTLQHEEKQVPLDSVDRSLTMQLNRERRVPFQLPE